MEVHLVLKNMMTTAQARVVPFSPILCPMSSIVTPVTGVMSCTTHALRQTACMVKCKAHTYICSATLANP